MLSFSIRRFRRGIFLKSLQMFFRFDDADSTVLYLLTDMIESIEDIGRLR